MLLAVELLGFSDLVALFRVSRTRVEQLVAEDGFPEAHPVGRKRTRVWDRGEVIRWAAERTPNPQKVYLDDDTDQGSTD